MTDKELNNSDNRPKRSLAIFYQIAGWIFFYYFWYRYFVVTDPGSTAFLLASVTTFFAALAVYLTIRTIIPMVQNDSRSPAYSARASRSPSINQSGDRAADLFLAQR